MAKLTVNFIKNLKATGVAYRRMDDGHPGFGLKVSPKGKVCFIFRFKAVDGRDVPMILGYFPETSLSEAREEWRKWRAVYDSGRDPKIIREEGLAEEESIRQAETDRLKNESMQGSIKQLMDAYIDDMKVKGKRSWNNVEAAIDANLYVSISESKKAKDITSNDIRNVLALIIKRDAYVFANRIRAYLSAAFTFGIQWDYDPNRHFEGVRFGIKFNPVLNVPKPLKSEKPRDRALTVNEVSTVWYALGSSGFHQKTVLAIQLLFALGGQRVEDILGLKKQDIDFNNQLITIQNTKNGNSHVIPFGSVAEPLLKEGVANMNSEGALFGQIKGDSLKLMKSTTLSHAITKLAPRLDMEHFQPKDIRRTVKTLMGFAGIRKEDRDRFQNHAMTDVSSHHYDRYDYLKEKRKTMEVWDHFLKSSLTKEVVSV